MSISKIKKSVLIGSLLATTITVSGLSHAWGTKTLVQPLTGADTLLTTYVSKSRISGALRKDNGNFAMDDQGNFFFDFDGDIYYPVTSPFTGKLLATSGPIGTVSGTALFPPEFAQLAFQVYNWAYNGAPMPTEFPASIHWTMGDITITDAGTTYVPFDSAPEDMGLYGRAFTGLGPVEIGQLDGGFTMSVRMGGCFAVQATEGVEAGKIGTYCLNSTFTFDLAALSEGNLTGKGSSNCTTVLQTPMM